MKYLITILFCLSFFMSQAQEPVYTPMRGNYKFKGIKIDTLLLIPSFSDTSAANSTYLDQVAGSMIRTGNDFWMRNANATAWLQNVNVGNGASPVMNFVNEVFKKYGTDSVFYIVAPSDTFFAFKDIGYDTTSLSNRINNKIDSIYRKSDSVFFKKNGYWNFAFKDSVGGGTSQNFANTDLNATNNRYHNFLGNSLTIDNLYSGKLQSINGPYTNYINIGPTSNQLLALNTSSSSAYGLIMNPNSNLVSLINNNNYAYLSRRAFGTDTIALKSDLTGLGGSGIDTIYRKSGKDSIYYKKNGVTYQIKDSVGGGGTNSPDRINGSATNNVTANMADYNLNIENIDDLSIEIHGNTKIVTDTRLDVQSSSAATKKQGQIQYGQGRNNIDLSSSSDTIYIPGTYIITNSGQPLYFPKANEFQGQIIHVVNIAGSPVDIYALSGNIYDQTSGTSANIQANRFAILSSDGTDWWIYNAN